MDQNVDATLSMMLFISFFITANVVAAGLFLEVAANQCTINFDNIARFVCSWIATENGASSSKWDQWIPSNDPSAYSLDANLRIKIEAQCLKASASGELFAAWTKSAGASPGALWHGEYSMLRVNEDGSAVRISVEVW